MKLLFIAHSFPYPLHEGIRLHVYHLLKNLSKQHDIHFVSFVESPEELQHLPHITPFCSAVQTVLRHNPKSAVKRLGNMLFDPIPYSVRLFESENMRRVIAQELQGFQPEVVHFDFTVMAQYASPTSKPAQVFFPHDAMSMLFERNVASEPNLLYRAYTASQARKMIRYEQTILPWFDCTMTVSPVDQAVLQSRSPGALVVSVPNGVDCEYFHPFENKENDDVIVFRGLMDFLPNHDAAQFFIAEVMPLIWKSRPRAEFWVAGPHAAEALKAHAAREPRIRILGFVPDIRECMAEAAVIVSPMRIGSGIKNKILESMAMAKAVVATPMSMAGISAQGETDLLIGGTASDLARQTVRLLENPALRQKIGIQGRSFVLDHHRWEKHAEDFTRYYKEAVAAHASRTDKK